MKKTNLSPPAFFLRFFRWFCHPALKDHVEGDLMELYYERLHDSGKKSADWKFAFDVMMLFRPSIIRPVQGYNQLNQYDMFSNYFKVGIRNILKYKVFSFINVFGLAVAMAVCMLIMLMLADQKSYDQFHEKKDRIYRILSDRENSKAPSATTPFPLAAALNADYPAIEETTQLTRGVGGDIIYNLQVVQTRGYFADPSFFSVFSYELEKGNKRTALSLPNAMVITAAYAHQLFRDENPIGKTVEFTDLGLPNVGNREGERSASWGSYTITGVIKDEDYRSHLKFDVLVSSASRKALYEARKIGDLTNDWKYSYDSYTYVLLNPGKTRDDLTASLNDLILRRKANLEGMKGFKLIAQKLREITPGMLVSNEPSQGLPMLAYYFLSVLALVIMVSACLNYTNLSTARALSRAKEIGIRKVTGAFRKNLVYQFLSESVLTALLALVMAVLLLIFLKPAFTGLWINQYLNFELRGNISVYMTFVGLALFVGILAGIYPALHLSKYQPIKALKNSDTARQGKLGMRKVLSVSQFIISLFFITTSILIYNQFRHYLEFEYGFNTENMVNIPLQGNNYRKVSYEFSMVPGVSAISASDIIPATGTENGMGLKVAGSEDEYKKFGILNTDEHFADNLEIKVIAGKNLPPEDTSAGQFILVNEAGVKAFGYQYPSQMVGQVLDPGWGGEMLKVIGVVKDFRFNMLANGDKIGPLALRNNPGSFNYVSVKIMPGNLKRTMQKLEDSWKRIDPVHAFKYDFFDDQLDMVYRGIFDVVSILGFIAFLAIVIACLGLLGMATYTAERRKKEVGIRKVLGAGNMTIALLLSGSFLKILVAAVMIGGPLSYGINNLWLQKLPNRVEFGFGTVFSGAVMLLVLGLLTIGSQTVRASKSNPVDSLKTD
jgi:putative ABC transport system permease protein